MNESRSKLLRQLAVFDQKFAELEELVPAVTDEGLSRSLTEILTRMRARSKSIEQLVNESKTLATVEVETGDSKFDISDQGDVETVRQATDESSRTERHAGTD